MAVSIKAELELEVSKVRKGAEESERRIAGIAARASAHARTMTQHIARISVVTFQGFGNVVATVAGVVWNFATTVLRMVVNGLMGIAGAAALAGTALAALGVAGTSAAIGAAADFEQTRLSIAQFTGSLSQADDLLREISTYAVKTPFETEDIEGTVAGLLSAGLAMDQVIQQVKDLGGISKSGEQLGELGDALGKGFAKGKYSLEEINKFLERQINLLPALSAVTGKYGDDLVDAISAGKIGYVEMSAAIASLTKEGGQFFGLLEKQSRTGVGLMSTLMSNVKELQRAFGGPILEAAKPALETLIQLATQGVDTAKQWGAEAAKAVAHLAGGLQVLADPALNAGLGGAFTKVLDLAVVSFKVGMLDASFAVLDVLGSGLTAMGEMFKDPFKAGELSFRGLGTRINATVNAALAPIAEFLGVGSKGVGLKQKAQIQDGLAISYEARAQALLGKDTGDYFKDAVGAVLQNNSKIPDEFLQGMKDRWNAGAAGLKAELERLQQFLKDAQATALKKPPYTPKPAEEFPGKAPTGILPLEGRDTTAAASGDEPAKAPVRKLLVGSVASAINLIMGRSAQELILDENKAQTGVLKKIEGHLNRIERQRPTAKVTLPAELGAPGRFAPA
jgi:tape measure domain-containing protein